MDFVTGNFLKEYLGERCPKDFHFHNYSSCLDLLYKFIKKIH